MSAVAVAFPHHPHLHHRTCMNHNVRRSCFPRLLLGWAMVLVLLTEYRSLPPSLRFPPDEEILNHRDVNGTITEHRLPRTVTIFYHLYVPKEDGQGQAVALQIVRQQLRQLSEALAMTPDLPPSVLYFTSIGVDVKESFIQEICMQQSQFQACHRLQHLDQGFEEHTLQALHHHCLQQQNCHQDQQHGQDHRVIYVHSKGSYHGSKSQNRWRRHMTDAVASRECIQDAHIQDCDLCGLLFVPRPAHHFTGNMFNAKCSYIQTLVPPMEFKEKMDAVYRQARQWVQDGILEANLFRLDEPWNSGTQRYAMEHWHGSHPGVAKVCDLSNIDNYSNKFWKSIRAQDRKPEDWKLEPFPRRPQPGLPMELVENESKRKREYFLLPGQLMKWYTLYGDAPPRNSWVWSWYPDGPFWLEQVQEHGSKAVEFVLAANQTIMDPE